MTILILMLAVVIMHPAYWLMNLVMLIAIGKYTYACFTFSIVSYICLKNTMDRMCAINIRMSNEQATNIGYHLRSHGLFTLK